MLQPQMGHVSVVGITAGMLILNNVSHLQFGRSHGGCFLVISANTSCGHTVALGRAGAYSALFPRSEASDVQGSCSGTAAWAPFCSGPVSVRLPFSVSFVQRSMRPGGLLHGPGEGRSGLGRWAGCLGHRSCAPPVASSAPCGWVHCQQGRDLHSGRDLCCTAETLHLLLLRLSRGSDYSRSHRRSTSTCTAWQ